MSFGTSISRERSWSIEPPSSYHLEALRRWLDTKLRDWRIRRRASGIARPTKSASTNGHRSPSSILSLSDPEADEHETLCIKHLNDAYQNWQNLSEMQKHEKWHSECVAALTQEQDRHRQTKDRIERLERHVQSLQSELNERSSRVVPTNFPISLQTAIQTLDSATDLAEWDYDKLIQKWQSRILKERSTQRPLPPLTAFNIPNPDTAQSPPYIDGAHLYTRPQQQGSSDGHNQDGTDGVEEEEDLVDAPGDEDDAETPTFIDRDLLDPTLRGKVDDAQDTVMGNGISHDDG